MADMKYTVDVDFNANVNELKQQIKEATNILDEKSTKSALAQDTGSVDAIKKIKNELKQVNDLINNNINPNTNKLDLTKFSVALARTGIDFDKLNSAASAFGIKGLDAFNQVTKSAYNFGTQIKESTSWLHKVSVTLNNTLRWRISNAALNAFSGELMKAYYFAKDLDESLTNIRIVSNQTHTQMLEFAQAANEAAKLLSASTLDYTNAALIYYQQGMNAADVKTMTEATIMGANIAGSTTQEMSELLTSTMNGYKFATSEAIKVTDTLAAVGAASAADFYELATAMSKVSSIAKTAGIPMESLTAQIATIVSVTKQAPETVGHALKTVYTRMLAFRNETKGMMVDENGESFGAPAVESALARFAAATGQSISLFKTLPDGTKELRNLNDVIVDIGNAWQNTTDLTAKFGIATALAGTRQQNNLIALFDTWGMYKDQVQVALGSEGTTLQQNAIYMESYQGHVKKMQASMEDLYMSIFTSDTIKPVLDALTKLFDATSKFVDLIGGLPGLLGIVAGIMAKTFSPNLMNKFTQMFGKMNFNLQGKLVNNKKMDKDEFKIHQNEQIIQRNFSEDQVDQLRQSGKELENYNKEVAKTIVSYEQLGQRIEKIIDNNEMLDDSYINLQTAYKNYNKLDKNDSQYEDSKSKVNELALTLKSQVNGIKNSFNELDLSPGILKVFKDLNEELDKEEINIDAVCDEVSKLQLLLQKGDFNLAKKLGFEISDTDPREVLTDIKANTATMIEEQKSRNQAHEEEIDNLAKLGLKTEETTQIMSSFVMLLGTIPSIINNEDIPVTEKWKNVLTSLGSVLVMNSDYLLTNATAAYRLAIANGAAVSGIGRIGLAIRSFLGIFKKFSIQIIAITLGLMALAKLGQVIWDAFHQDEKRLEQLEKLKSEYNDLTSEIDSLTSSIKSLQDQYKEGLENPSLMSDEELAKLKQEIKDKEYLLALEERSAAIKAEEVNNANKEVFDKNKVKVKVLTENTEPQIKGTAEMLGQDTENFYEEVKTKIKITPTYEFVEEEQSYDSAINLYTDQIKNIIDKRTQIEQEAIDVGANAEQKLQAYKDNENDYNTTFTELTNLRAEMQKFKDEANKAGNVDDVKFYDNYIKKIDEALFYTGELTKDQQKELNLPTVPSKVIDDLKKYSDVLDSVSKSQSDFGNLSKALQEFKDDGLMSADTVLGLKSAFDLGTGSFDKFIEVAMDGTSTLKEVEEAASVLVNEYLNSTEALELYTSGNEKLIISQLKALGVTNASEVAIKGLAVAEYKAKVNGASFTNMTGDQVKALQALALQAGATGEQIGLIARIYALTQDMMANGDKVNPFTGISTSDKIKMYSDWLKANMPKIEVDYAPKYTPSSGGSSKDSKSPYTWYDEYIAKSEQLISTYEKEIAVIQDKIALAEAQGRQEDVEKLTNELLQKRVAILGKLQFALEGLHDKAEGYRASLIKYNDVNIGTSQAQVDALTDAWFTADNEASDKFIALMNRSSGTQRELYQLIFDTLKAFKDGYIGVSDTITKVNLEIAQSTKELTEIRKEMYQKDKDALQELMDMTEEMVRQEYQNKIDALDKKIELEEDYINQKKEELRLAEDIYDYNRALAEEQKALVDIEEELLSIRFDDSAEANARRVTLEDELVNQQIKIEDTKHDRSLTLQEEALDRELELYKKAIEDEKELLQDFLDNASLVMEEVFKRLDGDAETLYGQLNAWNLEYGTGIQETITKMWEAATEALNKYKTALGTSNFESIYNSVSGSAETGEPLLGEDNNVSVGPQYYVVNRSTGKKPSEASTDDYILTGGGIYSGSGEFLMGYENGRKYTAAQWDEFITYIKSKFDVVNLHKGGTVGDLNLKSNEEFAKLLKGEYVVNQTQMQNFMKNVLPKLIMPNSILNEYHDNGVSDINIIFNVAGNLDETVIPDIKLMTQEVLEKINESMKNKGITRSGKKFAF